MSKADLTNKEDLSIAVMNLISLEEHLAFSAMKANNVFYLEMLRQIRKLRIKLLKMIIKNTEGEVWCISKHLLAATMRLMETSTKYLEKEPKKALELERDAFDLYTLFWFLQGVKNDAGRNRKKGKKA